MSFTNELSILPDNKESLNLAINQTINDIDMGVINPLQLKARLKYFEKYIDGIKDKLDEAALAEAEKYSEKKFGVFGMKVEVCEVYTKYDFSNTNDPTYSKLNEEKKKAEANVKEREIFLKSLTDKLDVIADGGEVVTIYPPIKQSKTGIKITL